MTLSPPARLTAAARRTAILEVAVHEFALHGLSGGSTELIAKAAGISQPYIFKLFGTKKELFMAAYDHVCARLDETYVDALKRHPGNPQAALDEAYRLLLDHRADMLMQLQAYAAAGDPEIQVAVRERERQALSEFQTLTGASLDQVRAWFAKGLLLTVGAALELPEYLENDGHQPQPSPVVL